MPGPDRLHLDLLLLLRSLLLRALLLPTLLLGHGSITSSTCSKRCGGSFGLRLDDPAGRDPCARHCAAAALPSAPWRLARWTKQHACHELAPRPWRLSYLTVRSSLACADETIRGANTTVDEAVETGPNCQDSWELGGMESASRCENADYEKLSTSLVCQET